MRISQDVDGVIFDLIGEWINVYNEKYNKYVSKKDVITWDFYKDLGIDVKECFEIFDGIDQRDLNLIDEKIPDYLEEMNREFDVNLVTLKLDSKKEELLEALTNKGIYEGTHYNKLVIHPYDVPHVKGTLNYDVFVDDSAKLAKSFPIPGKLMLLFTAPGNNLITNIAGVKRINTWKEILSSLYLIDEYRYRVFG